MVDLLITGHFSISTQSGYRILQRMARTIDLHLIHNRVCSKETAQAWNLFLRFEQAYDEDTTPAKKSKMDVYYQNLKNTKGAFETRLFDMFAKIGCLKGTAKGGSLIGDQVYRLFAYPIIAELFSTTIIKTRGGCEITVGSDYLVCQLKN